MLNLNVAFGMKGMAAAGKTLRRVLLGFYGLFWGPSGASCKAGCCEGRRKYHMRFELHRGGYPDTSDPRRAAPTACDIGSVLQYVDSIPVVERRFRRRMCRYSDSALN